MNEKNAKSFKIIRNYTDKKGVCKFLLVIHCKRKYVPIS